MLTAHPTQALRRSMLKNFGRIRGYLLDLQRSRLSGYERAELLGGMTSAIQAAWRTDEIRRNPPKPQDEMRAGLSYFNDTIFAVPAVLQAHRHRAAEPGFAPDPV